MMKKKKNSVRRLLLGYVVTAIFSMSLLIGVTGCVPTQTEMMQLGNSVDNLMTEIDNQQEKLTKEIDRVQGHVTVVNDAMKNVNGTIEKLISGNSASAPFNPYSGIIDAALKGLLAVTTVGAGTAGVVAVRKGRETQKLRTNIEGVAAQSIPEVGSVLHNAVNC